jgi:hypothetical protein
MPSSAGASTRDIGGPVAVKDSGEGATTGPRAGSIAGPGAGLGADSRRAAGAAVGAAAGASVPGWAKVLRYVDGLSGTCLISGTGAEATGIGATSLTLTAATGAGGIAARMGVDLSEIDGAALCSSGNNSASVAAAEGRSAARSSSASGVNDIFARTSSSPRSSAGGGSSSVVVAAAEGRLKKSRIRGPFYWMGPGESGDSLGEPNTRDPSRAHSTPPEYGTAPWRPRLPVQPCSSRTAVHTSRKTARVSTTRRQ